MRRKLGLLGAAAIALVAVAVPVALAWRVLPPANHDEVVSAVSGVTPVRMEQRRSVSRMVVSTPVFPRIARARVQVQVGTYGRAPSEPIQLVYRDSRGKPVASCRIPPSDYGDNGNVGCPVSRTDRVRQIAISARGPAPLAVYVESSGVTPVAGTLVHVRRDLPTLGARLRELEARVGVTRPVLFSPVVVLAALVASVALFGAAVLVLLRSELATRNRVTERPPLSS
jgi:hypothetical protein